MTTPRPTRYNELIVLIKQRQSTAQYPLTTPEDYLAVWDEALSIIDNGSQYQREGLMRTLINANDDDQGHIIQTVRLGVTGGPVGLRAAKLFLKVVTHSSHSKSDSLKAYVSRIYTLLSGNNGIASVELLSLVCRQALESSHPLSSDSVILEALEQLLIKDPQVGSHNTVLDLLKSLEKLIKRLGSVAWGYEVTQLQKSLDNVKLLVAKASPDQIAPVEAQPVSSFPHIKAGTPGGRHDNDFADISRIAILPTIQEIISDQPEYLPSTDFHSPHVINDPLERYIDTTFRLARHDILRPMKKALQRIRGSIDPCSGHDSQAQIYSKASIRSISATGKQMLEAVVSFQAPSHVSKRSRSGQREWWEVSSHLDEGRLVCFVSPNINSSNNILFLKVMAKNTNQDCQHPGSIPSALVSNDDSPSVTVKLAIWNRMSLSLLARLYTEKFEGFLVDFNGLYLNTFIPVLENLQRIQREGQISFGRWILPSAAGRQDIAPPLYARNPGFVFPLSCITKGWTSGLRIDPTGGIDNIDMQELERQTGLDRGQCHGLVAALTREYALIQGPPGTGKSYLGVQIVRALLAVQKQADLGPIIVCCYTNHALDQFLKHLMNCNILNIIRIGHRSSTPELTNKNLEVIKRRLRKTEAEKLAISRAFCALDACKWTAANAISSLNKARQGISWTLLRDFLLEHHPQIHRQLDPEYGCRTRALRQDPLMKWLGEDSGMTTRDSSQPDLRTLTRQAHVDDHMNVLFGSIDDAERYHEDIDEVHADVSQRTLAGANVIGITTTALARNVELLRRVQPKVVICEEAGELKEADIIPALIPGVEHLIQIGDHRQLRPQINVHSLSVESIIGRKWQLDRSQFERRAVGEPGLLPAPLVQLNVQRRMRPEISRLIRSVYPHLQDHSSVVGLPGVAGMKRNIFWLEHEQTERMNANGIPVLSHCNIWEAKMAAALAHHLIRQGEYKRGDVALLTPYTRQLRLLRMELDMSIEDTSRGKNPNNRKRLLDKVRFATVDNFQGEEAKIIIVSLVRSNPEGAVGFLGTENRINVLLSRAQHGMYLIGNSSTYLKVPMWADVYQQLSQSGAVGRAVEFMHINLSSITGALWSPVSRAMSLSGDAQSLLMCTALSSCQEDMSSRVSSSLWARLRSLHSKGSRHQAAMWPRQEHFVMQPSPSVRPPVLWYLCYMLADRACELHKGVRASFDHLQSYVFNAHTRIALCHATRRVPRVSNSAHGPVRTRGLAQCLVLRHAIASLAMRDAPKYLACGDKADARVDLMEFRPYSDVDLDESPIVVLGCGHFFTGETLDGLVDLGQVYTMNNKGNFDGLKDHSGAVAKNLLCCPDCKRPIRQFVARRYNRAINRAMMDEASKRLLIKGRDELDDFERRLQRLENQFRSSRAYYSSTMLVSRLTLQGRYREVRKVETAAMSFGGEMDKYCQPIQAFIDAIAVSRAQSPNDSLTMQTETLELSVHAIRQQILLEARLVVLKAQQLQLMDGFAITAGRGWTIDKELENFPSIHQCLKDCQILVKQAGEASLIRIVVAAILIFARIARLVAWLGRTRTGQVKDQSPSKNSNDGKLYTEIAQGLLNDALTQCSKLQNSNALTDQVQEMINSFQQPRYEELTAKELASIRLAMVSGPQSIATHSGHWYNCVNGHPFAIGDCGMPTEIARCPECGEPVGGVDHRPLHGVSRAEQMEREMEEPQDEVD
ncbi:hypothetical protein NM208_g10130 [Fusarium decemcellulare]|uniref:Uncharacterized protein n=1 Tax=Fusarium decemcellulare TaxID=57161 RepID=A0ACC1RYY9_9HYPO|nr:hypothetical protein NM208_g10130 [Fusarium decemcellulare]